MCKEQIIIAAAIGFVIVGGIFVWQASSFPSFKVLEVAVVSPEGAGEAPYVVPDNGVISQVVIPVEQQADFVIDITSAGFSPAELMVEKGNSVVWTNRDSKEHWVVAADLSPYPEEGGCGSLFDSCRGLKRGENFKVTFEHKGLWQYRDKLRPEFEGVIIVQ